MVIDRIKHTEWFTSFFVIVTEKNRQCLVVRHSWSVTQHSQLKMLTLKNYFTILAVILYTIYVEEAQ